MKLVEMKCKNCGAKLKVNSEVKEANCQFCGAEFKIDDEVQHVKYDDMEQAGYEFEKGKIRAQEEHKSNNYQSIYTVQQKKNNKTLWLVLAWIFLLPFMATYYIAKSDKLDKKKKIIIISIMWVVFLIIGWTSNIEESKNKEEKIVKCYSQEVYDKLDELIGMDNIRGNFEDTYTCEKLELKDNHYKKIEIVLDDDKNLLLIKVGDEVLYGDEESVKNLPTTEEKTALQNKLTSTGMNESEVLEAEKILLGAKIKSIDTELKTFDTSNDDKADIVKIKSNQFDKAYSFGYKECPVKMYIKDNKIIYLSSSNHFLVFYSAEDGYIDNISNCYTN